MNYQITTENTKNLKMNNNFYNKKITLIVPEELNYSFPPHIDLYVGTIEECYTKIKRYELDNDEFYNGHLILNNISLFKNLKESIFTKYFNNIDVTHNVLFTQEINHSGHSTECYLNEDIMYCNSFVFAIVANASRTNNNIYGDCICHRIELKTFNNENSSLFKWPVT